MSTAEVALGAKLYIDAVRADMPTLLKSEPEFGDLRGAFRDLGRWLVEKGAVQKEQDGSWVTNDDRIGAIPEEEALTFEAIYNRTVSEHLPHLNRLHEVGRGAYAGEVRSTHLVQEFEIGPKTISIVQYEDLLQTAEAALDFVDAAHRYPADAVFVSGADSTAIEELSRALGAAEYLLPGENPDRKAPLSEQAPRGTREQLEDIFFTAAAITANMEAPESVTMGDHVLASVLRLQRTVSEARHETIEATLADDAMVPSYFDSDLTQRDAEIVHDVINAGMRILQTAQFDTDTLDQVMYPADAHQQLAAALAVYDDNSVGNALQQPDFQAPGISTESGNDMFKAIELMRDMVELGTDTLRFSGDDGAELTDPGATFEMAEEDQESSAFEHHPEDDSHFPLSDLKGEEAELGADEYGSSDSFVRGSREALDSLSDLTGNFLALGAGEALAALAGRSDRSLLTMSAGRDVAAFATIQEAMGAGRMNSTPHVKNRVAENMSRAAWLNMHPARREKLRPMIIEPGKGIFEKYRSGSDALASKRMAAFVKNNLVKEDGTPNLVLRGALRQAATMPIVANTRAEAAAFRQEAEKFIDRERQEFELRQEKIRSGRDLKMIDVPMEKAKRFVDVATAADTNEPALLVLGAGGNVVISHEDAPRIDARLDRIGNLETMREGHKMGLIQIDSLRAAVETGAKAISIRVEEDRPYGVTGKIDEIAREREKPRARFEDLVLS